MAFEELFKQVCAANGWTTHGNEATVAIPGGRSQRIHWQQFRHENKDMVRLYSFIGTSEKLSQVRLEAALRLNFSLPHGALAIHSEKLVSRVESWRVDFRVRWLSQRFRAGPQSGSHDHVSSSRHLERSERISRTTLS